MEKHGILSSSAEIHLLQNFLLFTFRSALTASSATKTAKKTEG
jgi:hypothetical protein